MRVQSLTSFWLVMIVLMAGCSSQRVIPESMEALVDKAVTFREVVDAPLAHKGKVLVLGGEVLNAKRLKDATQIEFLQLPLDKREKPILDRQQSQGRFLALQQEFLDPATIVNGTKMTVVGEVVGEKTEHLDDVEYRYPVLIVKHLHTWTEQSPNDVRPRHGLSLGIFGGSGGRIGGGGGFGIGF